MRTAWIGKIVTTISSTPDRILTYPKESRVSSMSRGNGISVRYRLFLIFLSSDVDL